MVKRSTYQERFKKVAMPQNTGEAQAVAGLANSIGGIIQTKQKQDELKITNYSSQADLDMLKATSEYRNEMALDPMNTEAQEKLRTNYDKIFAEYDDKIGISAKGKWSQTKNVMKQQYEVANGKWILAQNIKNAESNYLEGVKGLNKKMVEMGKTGDYKTAMDSATLKSAQLRESVSGIIPQDQIEEDSKNFKSGATKNFIIGRISSNPQEALVMLGNENITKAIDSLEAVSTLTTAANTQIKRITDALDEKHKVDFIVASNDMIEDIDSLSLADIDQLLLDGMTPANAKALVNFKVKSTYAQKTDNSVYNEVNEMIADEEDADKITMHIIKNAGKLTQKDSAGLTKNVSKGNEGIDRKVEGSEADSLREYLNKINNGNVDVDEAVARFHKSVLANNYNGERIKEVAEGYKSAYTYMIDPTSAIGTKQIQENPQDIIKIETGRTVTNKKTGDKMRLDENGRWVNL